MQRKLRPEFSATEAQGDVTEISERERAKRLALFLSTVWEDPDTYKVLVKKFSNVEDLVAKQAMPEVVQYGLTPDDHESFPYETRAIYVTSEILRHGDDLEADPDPETAEAMRNELATERRKNPDANNRIIRLSALAGQISLYDMLQTPDRLRDLSVEATYDGYIHELPLGQADIA